MQLGRGAGDPLPSTGLTEVGDRKILVDVTVGRPLLVIERCGLSAPASSFAAAVELSVSLEDEDDTGEETDDEEELEDRRCFDCFLCLLLVLASFPSIWEADDETSTGFIVFRRCKVEESPSPSGPVPVSPSANGAEGPNCVSAEAEPVGYKIGQIEELMTRKPKN